MAVVLDIAEALKEAINAVFSPVQFTALHRMHALYTDEELENLRVTVVPAAQEISLAIRGAAQHDVQILVVVQQRLGEDATLDESEIAALMTLVESVNDVLVGQRLTYDGNSAAWLRTENAPICDREHLEKRRLFTGVLTLTYRTLR